MAKLLKRVPREHTARKAGARRAVGVAGRPLTLERRTEKKGRHAVRARQAVPQRPPLRERLAARVKQETRRLEPPRDLRLSTAVPEAARRLREAILPNDPRDREQRERSGEPVMAFVGAVDLFLLLTVVVLAIVGTIMIYSASMAQDDIAHGTTNYSLFRQTEWLLLGGVGMYIAMRMDYHRWRHVVVVGLVLSVLMLLALRLHHFSATINGATRWFKLGPIEAQPSEIAKMALVLYAAHWFAGQRAELRHSLRGLVPFGVVVASLAYLVFRQPDLGTTVVIVVSLAAVYFVAGARVQYAVPLLAAGAIGVKYYFQHLHGYQYVRYQAFLNPYRDPHGAGWQFVQMLNALGTGGWTGVGLGNGRSKFGMPEVQTDSIFAVLGEEWGLVGTLVVLALFYLFAVRGMRASILAPDPFGRLLAAGLTCSIVFQGMLNMAGVANVVPFTGVPLPFISYGGSSLSISMVATGILLNISKQAVDLREEHNPASTYLWWRNRRPHLSVAGRRAPTLERAAISRQRSAAGVQQSPKR